MQGFPRLLVEGFAKRAIDPSELVLITHRYEEVPSEVSRVVGVKDLGIGGWAVLARVSRLMAFSFRIKKMRDLNTGTRVHMD